MTYLRRSHHLAAAALAAGALAGAGPAEAASPWSAPASVGGPRSGAPTLAFDRSGLGVLAADSGGSAATGAVGPHTVGAVARGDAFGPLAQWTQANFALSSNVTTYAATRLVGLGTHFSNAIEDRAGMVFGTAGGSLTGVRYLGPTNRPGVAEALAANDRGAVAASFGVCADRACSRQRLYLTVRPAGGRVQRSRRIADAAVNQISTTAVNDRGDMLVAWQTRGGVFAQIRTAGGTLYAAQRLGNPGEPVTAISAALTPDRAAAVGWAAQAISEGDAGSPATVDATFKAAGATRHFHTSQRLAFVPQMGAGHYVSERRVRLVRSADGTIAAAWTGYQNGTFVVQAAQLSGYRFGAAETVSDPAVDSVLADLDAGPHSELAALWRTGVAGNDPGTGSAGLQAAIRAPGATGFGAAEDIEQGVPASGATLRFDPSTGRAIAAWGALSDLQTAVRAPVTPD